jgi:hypothetical protein
VTECVLQLREIALDGSATDETRLLAVEELLNLRTPAAVEALLELGGRHEQPDNVLRAAGAALAVLNDSGLVSQWDVRDLADPADDAFYE